MFQRENEILLLVGAGCSADAGIMTSKKMADELEKLLTTKSWNKYANLYYYLKSSMVYVNGLKGDFTDSFDIEKLVRVLGELAGRSDCILYPFVGSWNPTLIEIVGHRFELIEEFRDKIVSQLSKWITLDDYRQASYFAKFFEFAAECNYSLRLFSLNYDRCLEQNIPSGMRLESGFDSESRQWSGTRFDPTEEDQPQLYLYKLHGSLDWVYEKDKGIITQVDRIPETPDMIFGVDQKLQYIDPFLFYAHEFRKYSLIARVILVIGYSFNDAHINGIITQALSLDSNRKLLVVVPKPKKSDIQNKLKWSDKNDQIKLKNAKAREFLNALTVNALETDLAH
jgi:hypothetical protein